MAVSGPPSSVKDVISRIQRPTRALVTSGMPYANGPVHVGHVAGALLPADITARWLGLLIGRERVLFVCGSDDHGSTSEVAALKAGVPVAQLVETVREQQKQTIAGYSICLDIYTGTSDPECFEIHRELCQEFVRRLHAHGMLEKRESPQWYDPQAKRFLPDRLVRGRCPNPKCDNESAYGDECEVCGHQFDPADVIDPKSVLTGVTPELKSTVHWWLDIWSVSDVLKRWLDGKAKTWRKAVIQDVMERVRPALRLEQSLEDQYKALKGRLPAHKFKYAPGKQLVLQFEDKVGLYDARRLLADAGLASEVADEWAHRPITRDIDWGVPLPAIDPDLAGKTLYVWPDSLIAPISFSQLALKRKGLDPAQYREYWCDPDASVRQFLGQDNVFFYVLMQGALWLGQQADPQRLPVAGEFQLTDVFGAFHLTSGGKKMSKSTGNFYSGDELLREKGYTCDQLRYYLALLGLGEKPSDFDFQKLDERNQFLAGPMNAAFEKPISAALSKFDGRVPEGTLLEKPETATLRMVQRYVSAMEKANYPSMLFELENYARIINSLFTQYKPHDDRAPEQGRRDALYTCFYVLKNLMIMLFPIVPDTMDRLRQSLQLPTSVFSVDELGTPIPSGHPVGPKLPYFPAEPYQPKTRS